jgi:hypothetical protein
MPPEEGGMESGKEPAVAKEAKKAKKGKSRKTRATCMEKNEFFAFLKCTVIYCR